MTQLRIPAPPPPLPLPGSEVEAVSLYEPFASLVRTSGKTIETRGWPIRHRGWLLICAAKRRDPESLELLRRPDFQEGLRPLLAEKPPQLLTEDERRLLGLPRCGPLQPAVIAEDLHFGLAVALVDLYGCRRTETMLVTEVSDTERAFGNWSPGRYAWMTRRLHTFPPLPVRGAQGLFRVRLPEDFAPRAAG